MNGNNAYHTQKGSILPMVIFITTLLLFIGISLLNISNQELSMGKYFRDTTEAYYLAEAGLQKALSLLKKDLNFKWGSEWKQFLSKSHSLGNGKYTVSVEDLGSNKVEITSTGYVDKAKQQITAEIFAAKAHPAFFHALCVQEGDMNLEDARVYGDIYVGGDVTFGGFSDVRGNVKAVGRVWGQEHVDGRVYEYRVPLTFPTVKEEPYLTHALEDGSYYEENLEQNELFVRDIVFVEGDVIVDYISGDGLLFATGDITINNGEISRSSRGMPMIITSGTFTVNNPTGDVKIEAVVFADRFVCAGVDADFRGCIVARRADIGENVELRYDEAVLTNGYYHLPGEEAEEVYLKVSSWSHPDD